MSKYLMIEYDGEHFKELHTLGYLPIHIMALPEGTFTKPNIPHVMGINTVDGYAWLGLYLETMFSKVSWQMPIAATIANEFKKNAVEWTLKTDKDNLWLADYMCHDFHSRGGNPFTSIAISLGHSLTNKGTDTLNVIPASRYYYDVGEDEMPVNSVNASEHSVTCTGIFYFKRKLEKGELNHEIERYYSFDAPCEGSIEDPDYLAIAEYLNLRDWLTKFKTGILSYVADTFNLWKVITYILPRLKKEILARDGKLVLRPDSGDPVDIICGTPTMTTYYKGDDFETWKAYVAETLDDLFRENLNAENPHGTEIGTFSFKDKTYNVEYEPDLNRHNKTYYYVDNYGSTLSKCEFTKIETTPESKGVIELLWDVFGGTVNEQGYKVLDSHIGAIYGDAITLERQVQIYTRLADKKFAVTSVVLGVGSYTYVMITRDTGGYAVKGCWFQTLSDEGEREDFDIFKDPITDDGTKKSLKGFQFVYLNDISMEIEVHYVIWIN